MQNKLLNCEDYTQRTEPKIEILYQSNYPTEGCGLLNWQNREESVQLQPHKYPQRGIKNIKENRTKDRSNLACGL